VPKEIIRANREDPKKCLKAEIVLGRTVLSEEDEAEAYARRIWEMLRKEIMQDLMPSRRTNYLLNTVIPIV